MNAGLPFRFDGAGRTAVTDEEGHVRDMIEQVLFTAPGERVNRPEFGSGLLQMVFEPNGEELATATQFLVQGALQRWLGDRIRPESVLIESVDAELRVSVQYVIRGTEQRRVADFRREVPA